MDIAIADRNSNADALARLFSASLDARYISHGELQSLRALAFGTWAPNIEEILRNEIQERLGEPMSHFPHGRNWVGVIQAYEGDSLVGLALVSAVTSAAIPFGVIEDIVVENKRRGAGLGQQLIHWILDRFAEIGLQRTFVESGIDNERAHAIFERLGFKTVSVVMMRDG